MLARYLLILLLALPAVAARATDLDISLNGAITFDNNVLRADTGGRTSDGTFRGGPVIRLHDQQKSYSFNLQYEPVYEKFFTQGELDALGV